MFPGKEAFCILEDLACHQHQIWPDSCDGGIKLTEENASLQKVIHNACAELAKIYKNKKSKWTLGVSWECFVPFEIEDYNGAEVFVGVIVKVSLNGMYKGGVKFFSIELNRHSQRESPFKGEQNG
jgi:hypothetical protein